MPRLTRLESGAEREAADQCGRVVRSARPPAPARLNLVAGRSVDPGESVGDWAFRAAWWGSDSR